MSAGKRTADRAPPALALHIGSSKADLDAFLEQCGATKPNPYTVEEICARRKRSTPTAWGVCVGGWLAGCLLPWGGWACMYVCVSHELFRTLRKGS